jgi:hypothetical protein
MRKTKGEILIEAGVKSMYEIGSAGAKRLAGLGMRVIGLAERDSDQPMVETGDGRVKWYGPGDSVDVDGRLPADSQAARFLRAGRPDLRMVDDPVAGDENLPSAVKAHTTAGRALHQLVTGPFD